MKFSVASVLLTLSVLSPVLAISNIRMLTWVVHPDDITDTTTVAETIAALNATVPYDEEMSYYSTYAEVSWAKRRLEISNEVSFNKVGIFAIQGAYSNQMSDLILLLGSQWKYAGVGRDDGVASGEFVAVFYDSTLFKLSHSDVFWLTTTPYDVSKYSGAGSYRIATVARFSVIATGDTFVVISTHLDDVSNDSRKVGASLIRWRASYETYNKYGPTFLLGCLNSAPGSSSSDAYEIATGAESMTTINSTFSANYANTMDNTFYFKDIMEATPSERRSGHLSTVTGFLAEGTTTSFSRINFIMGPSSGGWAPVRYRVGENFFDDGYHMSNHRPLYVDLTIDPNVNPV
ncbi:Endonuclease/exonuclease/phosphatase [Limtongia smithiae]|uniref:Endonuclease/exonuclease/phosphatase n=1 Tax=Limtongia smithiae TaxID=1125753 RepID=UPI0034CE9996